MLDEEYSKLASNGNGIGLADMLYATVKGHKINN